MEVRNSRSFQKGILYPNTFMLTYSIVGCSWLTFNLAGGEIIE